MCLSCFPEHGKQLVDNAKTREVAALIDRVYDHHAAGGQAHIVVDDWNVEDDNIKWCLDPSNHADVYDCDGEDWEVVKTALTAMLELTEEERVSALAIRDGYGKEDIEWIIEQQAAQPAE